MTTMFGKEKRPWDMDATFFLSFLFIWRASRCYISSGERIFMRRVNNSQRLTALGIVCWFSNTVMEGKGLGIPKATKTGTTIVGLVYKDGLVLGADTRATAGPIVADKNCEKIHYLAPNMYCCGAGTAADTEMTTALISSQLELHRLSTGRQARVVTAMTLLKQMLFK